MALTFVIQQQDKRQAEAFLSKSLRSADTTRRYFNKPSSPKGWLHSLIALQMIADQQIPIPYIFII